MRFLLWKLWNRTRYYWPQAKARRRAIANFKRFHRLYGMPPYKPSRPWWIP